MSDNTNLARASSNKDDEFYTFLEDIENELKHYKSQFNNKVVLCNCDDPYESNFFKYFALNFNVLHLKKLICTCYDGSPIMGEQVSFFGDNRNIEISKKAYKIELDHVDDVNRDGAIDLSDVEQILRTKGNVKKLIGNGDYQSEECLKLLEKADIVVTNPPFSIFTKYLLKIMEYQKSFLIIGGDNKFTNKDIFPYILKDEIWFGYTRPKKFMRPDKSIKKFGNICWYTNLDTDKRHETFLAYKEYNEKDYPKYQNYDAIVVQHKKDIPKDYYEEMGVPATSFFPDYNPDQFEIIGCSATLAGPIVINGKLKKKPGRFYTIENGKLHRNFERLVIKRRKK